MGNQLFKEEFTGKYDGVIPPTLLAKGEISDGKNMRKVSDVGGWKPRKGFTLNNTTAAESGADIDSLHLYRNPLQGDRSFIAQCNSKLLKATNDPPATGTTFGTTLGVTVGTTPGFSAEVEEYFFYADGSGRPVAYGGTNPFPKAVFSEDASEDEFIELTRLVRDQRSDTEGYILGAAADKLIIVSEEPLSAVALDLGSTVNTDSVTMTVKAMRSGTWTAVSALSDGTESAGKTLAQDGTVSWTASSSDTRHLIAGVMGYAYQIGWSGALSNAVDLVAVTVTQAAALMTNKWHGVFEYVTGCRVYDQSTTEYIDVLGLVTNESTSQYANLSEATSLDFLYIKVPEPATAFAFGIPDGYPNLADAQVDLVEVLEGDAWTDISTLTDTTLDEGGDSSFAQTGVISWDASGHNPTLRTFGGDSFPGYWYRISWDSTLSEDTRVFLLMYASYPDELPTYAGCVEFKGRLVLWGGPEFPNKLRISQVDRPFSFTGLDSGYSEALGNSETINCAKNFYNELLVWKEEGIWLLEGYNMATFGGLRLTDEVGLASPQTAQVVEVGYPTMNRNEPMTIAIWQDVDGVYVLDGRKPRKVSLPVDHYFNAEYSTCISAGNIKSLTSFVDKLNNEYHLLIPDGTELVYNYAMDQWYPPWDRSLTFSCGLSLKGTDGRRYTYGGTTGGFVARLENDTSDKNASNADVAIEHYVKSRAISFNQDMGISLKFTLRQLYMEAKSQTAGSPVTTLFVDRQTTGTVKSAPTSLSLIKTGYEIVYPGLDLSESEISCFEVKLGLNTIDQEMELYSLFYMLEGQGLPLKSV